jgi:hypothetical protein
MEPEPSSGRVLFLVVVIPLVLLFLLSKVWGRT